MPAAVLSLVVTAGPIRGQRFDFTSHDTFLFGRAPDCHARLAPSDASASRHHFLLEVNPPFARLRDLGSLNGTRVNGVRHGGRQPGAAPGAAQPSADVDLAHGDEIGVGATTIRVEVTGATAPLVRPPAPRPARASLAPAPAAAPGDVHEGAGIGPYVVERLLGRGGMGAVYRACPRGGGEPVALKVLLPQMMVDEAAQEIFLREIEVTRALRHPRIVALLDFGKHEGRFYFALEYCPGGSVETLRRERSGRLPLASALRIGMDALDGLAAAHQAGFVHRDIKPDNLLLGADGRARVADFGLAKSFQQAGLSGMTATGMVAGTYYFMPREQLTAFRQVRPVSDVWSLSATLYHLLTGYYPRDFRVGEDPLPVILRGGVVPIRERDASIPEDLATVLDRALSDDPDRRHPHAGELLRALQACL